GRRARSGASGVARGGARIGAGGLLGDRLLAGSLALLARLGLAATGAGAAVFCRVAPRPLEHDPGRVADPAELAATDLAALQRRGRGTLDRGGVGAAGGAGILVRGRGFTLRGVVL